MAAHKVSSGSLRIEKGGYHVRIYMGDARRRNVIFVFEQKGYFCHWGVQVTEDADRGREEC